MNYDFASERVCSDKRFAGLMGMAEMEEAVSVMLLWAEELKGDLKNTPFSLSVFKTDRQKDGFMELLFNGWMTKSYAETYCYNGQFIVNDKLVDRLRERKLL